MLRPPRKPTPAPARRRDKRFLVAVPLVLHVGRRRVQVTTEDVGHGGIFLKTDIDVPLRQLVRIEMSLPPDGIAFQATGKPVHRIEVGTQTRTIGVGIQFYGLGSPARDHWDAFVSHVRRSQPEANVGTINLCHATVVEPLHRREATYARTFNVTPERLTDLVAFYQRAVSDRRAFILTDAQAYVDDEVGLQIVHPHTADVFELAAKITRCVRDGTIHGLELAFPALDEERAKRFDEFVYDALATFIDDDELSVG